MAKKIKFPLEMNNGIQVRTLDELRNQFDLDKVIEYFLDGKLFAWLEARYYEEELDALKRLEKNAPDFRKKVCEIFNIEYSDSSSGIDLDALEEKNRRLSTLKQYTSDPYVLSKIDSVAFDQEDLADLLDDDVHTIYLCNNSFTIPLRVVDKHYIGIGKVEAVIRSKERVDFEKKNIIFENINFDENYAKVDLDTPERIYKLGQDAENQGDYADAFKYYAKLAAKNHAEASFKMGWFYDNGYGIEQNHEKANEWYQQAAELGNAVAMNNVGANLENGNGVPQNIEMAKEWYKKAADLGNVYSMKNLGRILYNENNYSEAFNYFQKAANLDDAYSNYMLGWQYEFGQGVSSDTSLAQECYKKSSFTGYSNDNLQYDPTFRYGCNALFVYRDTTAVQEWFSERYSTKEQKVQAVNYIIQRFRGQPVSKKWSSCMAYSYTRHSLLFGEYEKNALPSMEREILVNFVNSVIHDFNKKQSEYAPEIAKEYYYYILAALICGDTTVSLSDADEFAQHMDEQISNLNNISLNPPIQQALNSMVLEENYNGGGLFAKTTYRVENESAVQEIVERYLNSTLKPLQDQIHQFVCQAFMDLAANLERYKRNI